MVDLIEEKAGAMVSMLSSVRGEGTKRALWLAYGLGAVVWVRGEVEFGTWMGHEFFFRLLA